MGSTSAYDALDKIEAAIQLHDEGEWSIEKSIEGIRKALREAGYNA